MLKNKIMKKTFYTLSVIMASILTISCSNGDVSYKMPNNGSNNSNAIPFEDYYEFISVDSRDKVLVSNLSFINSTNSVSSLSAVRKDISSPYLLEYDSNQFVPSYVYNSQTFSTYNIQDNSLSSLFGRGFDISLVNDVLLLSESTTQYDIYIPEILQVSVENLSSTGEIQPGTVIKWNEDSSNNNGVVLSAEYSPHNQSDASIARNYPSRIVAGLSFGDSGIYTVQSNDFQSLPNGSKVTFTIGRAGFVLTNDGDPNNDLSFGVYSSVKAEYVINY